MADFPRLFVVCSKEATRDEIMALFSAIAEVHSIKMIQDKNNGGFKVSLCYCCACNEFFPLVPQMFFEFTEFRIFLTNHQVK